MRGLGQVLKSFRDRPVDFPVYDRASSADGYLQSLGPLAMPAQGSRAGLGAGDPRRALQGRDGDATEQHAAVIRQIASG
jgi:deaminated glutathione amidase